MKVFIWFLFFLPIVYAAGSYDYYQLVLQWPPTVCRGLPKCAYRPPPKPLNFTIHGLWPTDSRKLPFNSSKIENLIPELEKYWPNLQGDDKSLWEDQWDTHGTCSETRFDEYEYFDRVLNLKRNIDILHYLESAEIRPSNSVTYESSEIGKAIRQGIGRKSRLWCKDNLLLEISVCYDSDLDYIDCPPLLLNYEKNKCVGEVGFPVDEN